MKLFTRALMPVLFAYLVWAIPDCFAQTKAISSSVIAGRATIGQSPASGIEVSLYSQFRQDL